MRAAIAAALVGDEQKREDPTVNELEERAPSCSGRTRRSTSRPRRWRTRSLCGCTRSPATSWSGKRTLTSSSPSSAAPASTPGRHARTAGRRRALHAGAGACRIPCAGDPLAADAGRLGREHAQRVAAGASGRSTRSTCCGAVRRARVPLPPRRRPAPERGRRERVDAGDDRPPLRHVTLCLSKGSAARSARCSPAGRRDGQARAATSTSSAARCGRRESSPRPASTRSRTTSTGSQRITRGRSGSRSASPRPGSRSIRTASRRTSSRSTWRRARRRRRWSCSPSRGSPVGHDHPPILRAVTHLDVDDEDIDRALDAIPRALGARVRA